MRQILLDTETTGLNPMQGHRIIEVGCVEMINRRHTGHHFHYYLNPEREIDEAATEVHGIKLEMLEDKPLFGHIAEELLTYIQGAELIIHNAPFDVEFLNHEFARAGFGEDLIGQHCEVLDTLVMARHKHPGQKNSLDALCKRYNVDNSQRTLHGALLDAEILADVYLAMTGGQVSLLGESEDLLMIARMPSKQVGKGGATEADHADDQGADPSAGQDASQVDPTPLIRASEEELVAHEHWLQLLDQQASGPVVWRKMKLDHPLQE